MKIDNLKTHIFEFVLLSLLFFVLLFIQSNIAKIFLTIFLFSYTLIIRYMLPKRKKIKDRREVNLLITGLAVICVIFLYLLGIYFGFYKSTILFSLGTVCKYIFPFSTIIICSEWIRYILISQKSKSTYITSFLAMVTIDYILYSGIYDIHVYKDFLAVVGSIVFASISSNMLYTYITKKFGVLPTIIYRLITTMYMYVIPLTPDIHILITSFIRLVYPYIVYIVLEYTYGESKKIESKKDRQKNIAINVVIFFVMAVIVMLVSCKFKYGILVIGSGSMTGEINKGDAIIYQRYDSQVIERGDIIIFEKDNKKVVHRVLDIIDINGQKRYYTKGDANKEIDAGYVTTGKIKGIKKITIRYIGVFSIAFRELFY